MEVKHYQRHDQTQNQAAADCDQGDAFQDGASISCIQ